MDAIEQHLLPVNGIHLNVHVAGPVDGRPVWLLHGFPECWHSWRAQIPALTAAGYRVFVPEMRGYGASDAPPAIEDYDLPTLCGDIRAAMEAFGQQRVAVVGHDWGALVAWHLALLDEARVTTLATLSVPYAGRPKRPATEILAAAFAERFNYILYFQQPGVAEAELDADIERSLRLFFRDPGDEDPFLQDKPAGARLFDGQSAPEQLPAWCSRDDLDFYLRAFAGRGFRGALNWYRNFERNWQRNESLAGRQVMQPTLFLAGEHDPVARLEAYTLKRMTEVVPQLEMHWLDCGHWIQNERPQAVNERLLGFLDRHYPA